MWVCWADLQVAEVTGRDSQLSQSGFGRIAPRTRFTIENAQSKFSDWSVLGGSGWQSSFHQWDSADLIGEYQNMIPNSETTGETASNSVCRVHLNSWPTFKFLSKHQNWMIFRLLWSVRWKEGISCIDFYLLFDRTDMPWFIWLLAGNFIHFIRSLYLLFDV